MEKHDIELPQGYAERPFDYSGDLYTEGQMRAAIEADRKRRGEPVGYIMPTALKQLKAGGNAIVGGVSQGFDVPLYADPQQVVPLTDERIRLIWKETRARMGVGGDPVLWFARAIERAHGISAPQPAESTFTTPDCPQCGCVQDGHCLCNPSKPSAEPVKVPSDADICGIAIDHETDPDDAYVHFSEIGVVNFVRDLLARYGQHAQPAKPRLKVFYDDKVDCLYVDCNDSDEPFDAEEDDMGILYRYAASDGRLIGITVMNFMGQYAKYSHDTQRPAKPDERAERFEQQLVKQR